MEVRVWKSRHIHIICIEGDILLAGAVYLKKLVMKMIEKKAERIIIDAGKISSIDSSGIGAFIFISSTLKKLGLPFAIANVRVPVAQVLETIKLTGFFPLYTDLNSAVKKLSEQSPARAAL